MKRFFFHVHDDALALDDEGRDLANLGTAIKEAEKGARELMCDQMRSGYLDLSHFIAIEDERQCEVGRVVFSDVVTIKS